MSITDYAAIQLYVGHKEYQPVPPVVEEDNMLDFEDIGGQYDTQAAATLNTSRLNAYLADANVASPSIRFGGPLNTTYNNKRVPGRAYFDGTVILPAGKPIMFDGANSRLSWSGLATATTPSIEVENHAASVRCILRDFDADTDGSGILFTQPGKGTVARDIRFADPVDYAANACTAQSGVVSLDDHTDITTASYAFKIFDSDGFSLLDCSAMSPGDYGIICTRLHDGVIRARVWGSKAASGVMAEGINGSQVDIINESNYGFGYDLSKCGVPVIASNVAVNLTHNKPSVSDFWVENNNYRGNTSAGGIKVRQGKLRHCGSQFTAGSNAWGSNKIDMDEGTRNRCVFVHDVYVAQSITPMYDLNNENDQSPTFILPDATADAANNNFDAVWGGAQPTVTTVGTTGTLEFLISFPANSLAAITGATAYWRPWGTLTNFTTQDGDGYEYQMELSTSSQGYNWCVTNDNTNSTLVVPTIAPYAGPAGANWVGLYNAQTRKFIGRISFDTGNTGHPTPAFTWDPGLPDNTQAFTLSVKSLQFYGIRASGGAIPQS